MSYSFNLTAATKAEAIEKVAVALNGVVLQQPEHEADSRQTLATAEAYINMLTDPDENQVVYVNVSGSLGWRSEGVYISSNVSVSCSVLTKPQA